MGMPKIRFTEINGPQQMNREPLVRHVFSLQIIVQTSWDIFHLLNLSK